MSTLEKIIWVVVIIILIIKITTAIVVPIYNNARAGSRKIENVEFIQSYNLQMRR